MASISQARDAIPATQRTATDAAAAIVGSSQGEWYGGRMQLTLAGYGGFVALFNFNSIN